MTLGRALLAGVFRLEGAGRSDHVVKAFQGVERLDISRGGGRLQIRPGGGVVPHFLIIGERGGEVSGAGLVLGAGKQEAVGLRAGGIGLEEFIHHGIGFGNPAKEGSRPAP